MIQVKPRNPFRRLLPNNDFQIETFDSPEIVRAKLETIMGEKPALDPLGSLKRTILRQPPLASPLFSERSLPMA